MWAGIGFTVLNLKNKVNIASSKRGALCIHEYVPPYTKAKVILDAI